MLDAYTVKKAIPRVVVAVIAINLSIYLCIAAIDITTIIGRSLHSLLVTPFVGPDSFKEIGIDFSLANAGLVGVLGAGAMLGAYSVFITIIGAGFVGLLIMLLPIIISITLIALAVLFTLIIRQGLLVFLTVISPLAIVCYILPGTEKYFKQWWDLFLKTLLVYPIIAAIFAMSNVLAAILLTSANGSSASMFPGNYFAQQTDTMKAMQILVAIIVLYLPLVLIPFAFKIAGGAIAAVMNMANQRASGWAGSARKGIMKSKEDPNSFIGSRALKSKNRQLQKKADWAENLKQRGSDHNRNRFSRRLYRGAAGAIGGVNAEARASAARAATGKLLNDQINTGRDEEIRGLTVNKALADSSAIGSTASGDGHRYSANNLRRINSNGQMEYKSLGGAWVKEADVNAGYSKWGNDAYAQQAALSYEMRKSISDDQIEGISTRYNDLAKNAWGMSDNDAFGAFKGAAFENQNTHLDYKYTNPNDGKLNSDGFVEELYEKRGTYNISQLTGSSIKAMRESHAKAQQTAGGYDRLVAAGGTLDAEQQLDYEKAKTQLQMHESIADNFGSQTAAGLGGGDPSKGEDIMPTGRTSGEAQFGYSSGAAHVTDELKAYFNEVKTSSKSAAGTSTGPIDEGTPRDYRGYSTSTPDPTSADGSDARNQRRF